jgi:cbb3-type cytochrome c oxidase subunit III
MTSLGHRLVRFILPGTAALLIVGAFSGARTGIRAQPAPAQAGAVAHGRTVYEAHCVECHGETGRGDGPASSELAPRPRDFSAGKYKIRSTDTGSVPTDQDLVRSVRQGLFGTAMPAWSGLLPEQDIADVVQYVKSLSPSFAAAAPPKEVDPGADVPVSPAGIARGQRVYEKLQCGKCHGTDGRGAGAVATSFVDDWNQPLRAADLSEPWTFHGGPAARDVFLRFRVGMTGTPMPSFAEAASDAELWDLANYVVSLARKPVWAMSAPEVGAFYATLDADARANPAKRGRALVEGLGCAGCHTPTDEHRRPLPDLTMAGGMVLRIEPFGDYPTGNLTSDKDTGLGSWTDEEIKRVLTRGVLRDGTRLLPYPMDWPSFSTMTPDDLNAVVGYLRTIPPVRNKVPRPSRPFLPVYLWGKFKMLILQQAPPITFYPGNVGVKEGR